MIQAEALKILKKGHSVFLTGAAGSGKTYLLNQFIAFARENGLGVGITASTGIAATHLGGLTIHSWAGIGIDRELKDSDIRMIAADRRVARRFAKNDILIIDEISMLDADRLSLVDRVARAARASWEPFGGMQVVFCGDFFQLPPVAKAGEKPPRFAFHSSAWRDLNPKVCYLTEQFRQADKGFFRLLNAIRQAEISEETKRSLADRQGVRLDEKRITKLYCHNINVDAENARELANLPGPELVFQMESAGISSVAAALKKGCLAAETLVLKKNALVMFVKNNFEKGYVNGTLGRINGFDQFGRPVVEIANGRQIVAAPENWMIEENGRVLAKISQVPLRLAWAITIHKSQGMTLDAAEIDLSNAFEKGMGYVALSRVRSLSGMRLLGFNDMALAVHPEISALDREWQRLSEETIGELKVAPKKPAKVRAVRKARPKKRHFANPDLKG